MAERAPTINNNSETDCSMLLEDDLRCVSTLHAQYPITCEPKRVFVTGATGFLGTKLIAALLRDTPWEIYCLVRAHTVEEARNRLLIALVSSEGAAHNALMSRIVAVPGDINKRCLGLTQDEYDSIASATHIVFHCAAEVNWIKPFSALHSTNVLGTIEMIRFAFHKVTKPFHFISSLAVCYSVREDQETLTESSDLRETIHAMPLGYAQSKCVAEILLLEAKQRGLPLTIIRPGLISGDSLTGISNRDDFISRLLKGCIALEAAANIDWLLDIVPVEYVANVITSFALLPSQMLSTIHIHQPHARTWRGIVLWLNLYGYRLPLVDYEEWLQKLIQGAKTICPELYALRSFFLAQPNGMHEKRLPSLYLESQQKRIDSSLTNGELAIRGLSAPPVDTHLLRRYLDEYVASGYIPPSPTATSRNTGNNRVDKDLIESLVLQTLAKDSAYTGNYKALATVMYHATAHFDRFGIISELSSAYGRSHEFNTGFFRHSLDVRLNAQTSSTRLELLIKTKGDDSAREHIAHTVGRLSSKALDAYPGFLFRALGLVGAHVRELALYEISDARLDTVRPKCYGTVHNSEQGLWLLALEYIDGIERLNTKDVGSDWHDEHRDCAIRGLAKIHSYGYSQCQQAAGLQLLTKSCALSMSLGDAYQGNDIRPFWLTLAQLVEPLFSQAWRLSSIDIQSKLIESMPLWWRKLQELPQTLIHNDFNPRNLAFRRNPTIMNSPLSLFTFDWELATVGVPQHDLAELLCFTLPEALTDRAVKQELTRYIDLHRVTLQHEISCNISAESWQRGFCYSLNYLLVNRLALYALLSPFSPQPFLRRVLRNWLRIYRAVGCHELQ
jgi:thioester reductase-like protein